MKRAKFAQVVGSAIAAALLAAAANARAQLPPPPEPPENPTTKEKALLGKALFWEEQLSSDDTVACGTCHRPATGGGDPRTVALAGPDGFLGTGDDVHGSPGVLFADASHVYQRSAFGFDVQVTDRMAPSFIGAQYFSEEFWDGRASTVFVEPQNGNVSILDGGSLESQSIAPPMSTVEMAHGGRDWTLIIRKLQRVVPLRLSPQLSGDLAAALGGGVTYPDLFSDAFGDPAITAERIAFAIAAYERTLVPDDTPWDRFNQGSSTALTLAQQRGLTLFNGRGNCRQCHPAPLFSDNNFHNIGVRPGDEDLGRELVTGDPADHGSFKTPSLRNALLRGRQTHRGTMVDIAATVELYNRGGDFFDNLDPLIGPLFLTKAERRDLTDFVANGLVDARVAAETAPFDRPLLHSESVPANPSVFGVESAGSGGFVPRMLAVSPPSLGNDAWALGTAEGLGGAAALLILAPAPGNPGDNCNGVPLNIAFLPPLVVLPYTLSGAGDGDGSATLVLKISANGNALIGQTWYAQWFVADAAAVGGYSASMGAEFTFF